MEKDGEPIYAIAVCCKEGVAPFDPPLPPYLRRDTKSRDWLLTKRTTASLPPSLPPLFSATHADSPRQQSSTLNEPPSTAPILQVGLGM